ncbi:MAG: YigZ family protein, partial [Bacteroidota bacterium]|nr:YigZ family protein [Bacteroidota bacterium]MDX5430561.1 YigZ family protein [Bacteroidota bacterium]MDX5469313.1 YigZ family protein [Bacteroidota bacterium]
MHPVTEYFSITSPTFAEFKDRGSKFFAYAYPVENEEDIRERLEALRQEFPDATHHCYAWVLGADR